MKTRLSKLQALLNHPAYVEALGRVRQRWGERAPLELLRRAIEDARGGEPIAMTFEEVGPFAWVKVERSRTGMNWFYYVRTVRGFVCDEAHLSLPLVLRDAGAALDDVFDEVLSLYETLAYSEVARGRRDVFRFREHARRGDGAPALAPDAWKRVRGPRFTAEHLLFCASSPWEGVLREVRVHTRTFEVETTDLGPGFYTPAPHGRAYREDGASVQARLVEGRCEVISSEAPAGHRAALARAWRERGLVEHASLGSFARAQAELLAMGAPLALLARMHQAALDEIRHATVAFGVAAGLDERSLIAGPLPALAPREPSWRRLIEDTLHEAAIPETLAAVELRAAAREAHDPVLARLLHEVAEDEERHAALAWDTLAWALGQAPAAERGLLCGLTCPAWAGHDELPDGLGFLGARGRAEVHAQAWQEQVVPCLNALAS